MISFEDSTRPEIRVVADVLAVVLEQADRLGTPLLLVGAAARDLLVTHHAGSPPARATADVDVAVAVESWEALRELTGAFEMVGTSHHKIRVLGVEVDVVPFGGLETPARTITWPDDVEMNVVGFDEAHRSARAVLLPGGVRVLVPSLGAQTVLKLFAWRDRGRINPKDAIDIHTLLLTSSEGSRFDALYGEHLEVMEACDYDPLLAGAHVLGLEAREDVGASTAGAAASLLAPPERLDLFVLHAGGRGAGAAAVQDLVASYLRGLIGSPP